MLREYNHQKGLISLHVPKTGGTSFTTIVRDWFSESFYSFYPERDPECIHTKLRAGSCIHGHFNRRLGYGIEAIYPDADQFIAILRDPVLQQISMYHYKMQRYSRGLSSWDWELQGIPRSIDHFFEEYAPTAMLHLPVGLGESNFKERMSETFIHIGILEKFERSVNIIAEKLGKHMIPVSHLNRTSVIKREKPSSSAINSFIDQNPALCSIYEFAESLNQ